MTYRELAESATDELRRQLCRHGPHDETEEAMMACGRCRPIVLMERMLEEERRVSNGG